MPKAGFTHAHAAAHRGDRLRHRPGALRARPGDRDRRSSRARRTATAARYGISDFRFFGLRDNNSSGPTFQQHFGLLRDDYSEKPAFAVYRRAVARYGAPDR